MTRPTVATPAREPRRTSLRLVTLTDVSGTTTGITTYLLTPVTTGTTWKA
jgi:uncharacterized protein with von Willebrand factor type A (vWA) domain